MNLTASEVAAQLARDARGVCEHLLPNGRERNGEWCVGSVHGEEGGSLKVRLTGGRAGRWKDFASDAKGGDLLDLWAAVRGQDIGEALREACEHLGIRRPQFEGSRPQRVRVSVPKGAAKPGEAERRWLTETRRIAPESVTAYRVGAKDGAVLLPAFTPGQAEIQYIKYRSTTTKQFWSEKGGQPCLFGWQAIPPEDRQVVICEGELDALAWHSYGFPALSPTNGASNTQWIDYEFDRLARFDQIYLSLDMDEAGRAAVAEIVERLGRERCFVVDLPRKDANECRMAGDDAEAMIQAIGAARSCDPDDLVSASAFADDVVSLFYPEGDEPGVRLPWRKGQDRFLFRPGELVILPGVNGHGKTEMAGHCTLAALEQGWRGCVASMEFRPAKWLRRLTRQAAAIPDPDPSYIRAIHDWYDGRLWVFNAAGTAKASRILEVFRYAVRRYRVQWFVVDNLAKCGFAEDDYNGQKRFVEDLGDFARDLDVIVVLCAHMRKVESENRPLGKMDVKGTGAITDVADSVLPLWRNKTKEKERRLAQLAHHEHNTPYEFDESEEPDAVLSCTKQRNGEDEPSYRLWFHVDSHQFLDRHDGKPHRYVRPEARRAA